MRKTLGSIAVYDVIKKFEVIQFIEGYKKIAFRNQGISWWIAVCLMNLLRLNVWFSESF